MTLEQKFGNNITGIQGRIQIADEFAIGFADWFVKNNYEYNVGYYEASELLEIYKKEKGL
jgi:hypothetical protein